MESKRYKLKQSIYSPQGNVKAGEVRTIEQWHNQFTDLLGHDLLEYDEWWELEEIKPTDTKEADRGPYNKFEVGVEELINSNSLENESDTPDYISAEFLRKMFELFNSAIRQRTEWLGIKPDTKEVFIWNDKTVLEFLLKVLSNRMFGQVYTPETEIKNFKQSKESLKPDSSDFVAKGMKMGYDYYVDEKNKRLYTQQQYNEAIVNAFESAKQTIADPSNIHQLVYKFPTIESYLTSISNNK